MNFTSKDLDQILTFKQCLGLKNMIGRKSRGGSTIKKYFQVQFGDVLFYQWLLSIGLKPAKSKTLTELKIPDKYFFDFLRGCFDGDGSIYAYWDPRWHSSYMFYSAFVSASPPFLTWLQKTISRLARIKGTIVPSRRVEQLRFAKKETRTLFKKMFYQNRLPHLKRKLIKAQKFFSIDENHP